MFFVFKRTIKLGAKSLWMHRLRSSLTTLGIIFGVCSVIAMLAIGEGASRQAQAQYAHLGITNVILKTVKPPQDENPSSQGTALQEYGLTYDDAERIRYTLPNAEVVVPLRRVNNDAWYRNRKIAIEVVGTVPWYTETASLEVLGGRFLEALDMHYRNTICVIDQAVYEKLFPFSSPLGHNIKVNGDLYTIVGVVTAQSSTPPANEVQGQGMMVSTNATSSFPSTGGVSGTIYIPLTTVKQRFGEITYQRVGTSRRIERVELQQITVKVPTAEDVEPARDVLIDLLGRFHKKQDYQVVVPLELLNQAKQTRRIFSIVLGSIAAISLLVGGIGIMNIMLATVSERTREIGIRRALGARRRDIIFQFLSETLLLTFTGGVLGILLGALIPELVERFGNMPTVITPISLILSFGISGAVGMVFGWYPAWRAANMDPIESLRHE